MMDFLPEQFDPWAANYDKDVATEAGFPFAGYAALLQSIVDVANPQPNQKVLDLGCGTGNLAAVFSALGCLVWGTDFSSQMIARAHQKYPDLHFSVADVRDPLPADFPEKDDHILSAYVFHHFPVEEKIKQMVRYKNQHLIQGGTIIIGDLMFPSEETMQAIANQYPDSWDDEFYWIMERDLPLMQQAGLVVQFQQISFCAGLIWFGL
jgi:putative AdoMet-dependent methyltransferase